MKLRLGLLMFAAAPSFVFGQSPETARTAFAGEENLHAYTSDIAALKAVYDSLVAEAAERGLAWR